MIIPFILRCRQIDNSVSTRMWQLDTEPLFSQNGDERGEEGSGQSEINNGLGMEDGRRFQRANSIGTS